MKQELIREAFRLQTLAGLRPINEINEGTNNSYCYGMFDGMDYAIDDNSKQVQIDPEELVAKGYKKLEFTTWEGFINSAFAKKNQGQIGWDLFHHQGKRFFDMYSQKYGPFIVYVQDSILERNK
jgi:hypothetical protein